MCEQARPSASVSFFSLLKQTRGAALRGLPLWYGVRLGGAVFAAAKTSGRVRRNGGAIVRPARFASAKRRPSARNHPTARQADHAPRDRARFSGQEKGSEAEGRACSYIRISDPFSYRLPQHLRTQKRRFSRELEGGFYLKSRPSNVPSSS